MQCKYSLWPCPPQILLIPLFLYRAHRGPERSSSSEAIPTSRARGVHGAPPGEESLPGGAQTQKEQDEKELDAAQMAAPGEGKISSAVHAKAGASGSQPGLESDLDKKKKEQAPAREAMKQEKQNKVDVGGVLGQRGGPAETVGNRN